MGAYSINGTLRTLVQFWKQAPKVFVYVAAKGLTIFNIKLGKGPLGVPRMFAIA